MFLNRTTSSPNGSLLTSQLKPSNGLIGAGGLEIGAGHLGDLQGLFLHQQPLKREPEDLSHHRGGGGPKSNADGLNQQKTGRPKVVLVASAGGNQQQQDQQQLVVDVINNNNNNNQQQANNNNNNSGNGNGVKEEYGGHHSPQHNSRSINGTPSSTSSLIADMNPPPPAIELISTPDGLKPVNMYGTHIFTTMSGQHADGGGGTPSPNSYEHAQYTTSSVLSSGGGGANPGGYVTTSAGRAPAFADPYAYREYFGGAAAAAEPGPYGTQIRQTSSYGSDTSDASGAVTNAAATASFVERYVRQSSYHNKGVIAAAGLTVDLPSPDSGIGADAITPRDQNAIPQVSNQNILYIL